jgi:hypothetical protein
MTRQNPNERPGSIAAIKTAIQKYGAEAISLQKLSQINATVIKVGEIDEPLAYNDINLQNVEYHNGQLILTLDRPINQGWIEAFHNMGNYSSIMGADPHQFHLQGNTARIGVQSTDPNQLQMIVDYFKGWLPKVTLVLRNRLENELRAAEQQRREKLDPERRAEEQRLRINKALRV